MNEIKSSGKEFRELATDMIPVLKDMEIVLKKHNIRDLASVSMSIDGYFRFNHAGTKWDYVRLSENDTPKLKLDYAEELEWRE